MEDTARCRREIAAIEAMIVAGHRDLQGLCLALSDWCAELRLIEQEMAIETERARRSRSRAGQENGQGPIF